MLRAFDVAYFAASVDDAKTNKEFAESLELDYPILSDPDKKVAEAYGVLRSGYAARHLPAPPGHAAAPHPRLANSSASSSPSTTQLHLSAFTPATTSGRRYRTSGVPPRPHAQPSEP